MFPQDRQDRALFGKGGLFDEALIRDTETHTVIFMELL